MGGNDSGLVVESFGVEGLFALLVLCSLPVLWGGSFRWLPETPASGQGSPEVKEVVQSPYEKHKQIYLLAAFIAVCAIFLAAITITSSNQVLKGICTILVAFAVCGALYVSLIGIVPDVAKAAAFVFLREAMQPNIDKAKFYWLTDAEEGPNFTPSFMGVIDCFALGGFFIGIAIYNRYMCTWQYRMVFAFAQVCGPTTLTRSH